MNYDGSYMYKSADEYVDAAQNFLNDPPEGTMTKIRDNGDIIRFNETTDTYASMDQNGYIKRYMKARPRSTDNPLDNGFDLNVYIDAKDYFHAN